jgi:hypothetical protein
MYSTLIVVLFPFFVPIEYLPCSHFCFHSFTIGIGGIIFWDHSGVLRLYCDPWYFFRLAQKLPDTNNDDNFRRIKGTVTSIVLDADDDKNNDETNNAEHYIKTMKKVLTYTDHDSSSTNDDARVKTIAYDYLIIATGATYAAPISPATTTIGERGSILDRNNEWHNAHTKLKGAKRVLILGGG